ncbi:RNA polymerase sigma factor SigX [Lederbergia lenta]|uniref:RNA polymerase sigma factor n=1 Tax=Lederbergia lenta TaxID=1467 RepID=A0A2X4VWQ9_LEDLE|nr:RNA polymerase sigma factor SigX [Lederbergia lenta]MEC2325029.1 RNA polymerase sigma factor SigX [Lederbergia lenta]SQI56476.1 RNA polymerase sigma factor SigX [Lederbergia lenta]
MDSVFHDIYEKYHQDLFRFLFYMLKSREETEDLVQEVYIRVIRSYQKFEGKSTEKTWIFSIAKNVAMDHFRKQKGWKERIYEKFDWDLHQMKDTAALPEEEVLKNEDIRYLYSCLDKCSTNQRLVLVMRFLNGFSVAETAEVLNWSVSKVKTTQHRALNSLKILMENVRRKEGDEVE